MLTDAYIFLFQGTQKQGEGGNKVHLLFQSLATEQKRQRVW